MKNDHIPDGMPNEVVERAVAEAADRARHMQTSRNEVDQALLQSYSRQFEIGPNLLSALIVLAGLALVAWCTR